MELLTKTNIQSMTWSYYDYYIVFKALQISNRYNRKPHWQVLRIPTLDYSIDRKLSFHTAISLDFYYILSSYFPIHITLYYIKGDCYPYNLSVTSRESCYPWGNQSSYLFQIIMQIDFHVYALCNFNVWKK